MKIRGRAPLRIGLGGGGTDINSVFEIYGGIVINATIDKYTIGEIEKRDDKQIFINEKSLNDADDFSKAITKKFCPTIGFNFSYYNEIPPRRGLGSSSTYSVLLLRLMSELEHRNIDDHSLVEQSYGIESDLGICGWQDQYATAIGGFNYMQFDKNKKLIFPLRLKYSTICDLESRLILVFTDKEHDSYSAQEHINTSNWPQLTDRIITMKNIADDVRDELLRGNVRQIGELLDKGWQIKKQYTKINASIESLYSRAKLLGAIGGKLLGAGDGGYMLFFIDPNKKMSFINNMTNAGAEVLQFHFTEHGVETWIPKD